VIPNLTHTLGHTVVVEGKKYAFHLMPSGILNENSTCLIGNGVVLHIPTLFRELGNLDAQGIKYDGRIKLSDRAHIVFDFHQEVDGLLEEEAKKGETDKSIGTTKKGIGPAYASKISRMGVRVGDLRFPETLEGKLTNLISYYKRLFPSISVDVKAETQKYVDFGKKIDHMIIDSVDYINKAYDEGKKIMIEGANATMLDVDFGTWPYVTSSNASIGGAVTGLGIAPNKIDGVIGTFLSTPFFYYLFRLFLSVFFIFIFTGIMKAYTTRVGAGPFPTEIVTGNLGNDLRKAGNEYGTTTGRPRRCGWLDTVAMKYTHRINNFATLNLTKLDVLSDLPEIQIGVAYKYNGKTLDSYPSSLEILSQCTVEYETLPGWMSDISGVRFFEDLPPNCLKYVERIEELVGCNIGWVSSFLLFCGYT